LFLQNTVYMNNNGTQNCKQTRWVKACSKCSETMRARLTQFKPFNSIRIAGTLRWVANTISCFNACSTHSKLIHCNWHQYLLGHHHHFWQAPLRVCSAERRHQSPEWMVLSQVNCVVHIEVAGFQILLNGFHPWNTSTSHWSPPVLSGQTP